MESSFTRTRWAAIGAAVAVAVGAGGLGIAGATGGGTASSSIVPIEPCRLLDTRPGPDNVGDRSTPLGPAETETVSVHGVNGNCDIPSAATGIVANVTAVGPSANTYLTLWPSGATRPLASHLNVPAGATPTPNAATVAVSNSGAVDIYNNAGEVHVIVDVNAYVVPLSMDTYTRAEVDAMLAELGGPGDETDSPDSPGQPATTVPAGSAGAGDGDGYGSFHSAATFTISNTGCPADHFRLMPTVRGDLSVLPTQPSGCVPRSDGQSNTAFFDFALGSIPQATQLYHFDPGRSLRSELTLLSTGRTVWIHCSFTVPFGADANTLGCSVEYFEPNSPSGGSLTTPTEADLAAAVTAGVTSHEFILYRRND